MLRKWLLLLLFYNWLWIYTRCQFSSFYCRLLKVQHQWCRIAMLFRHHGIIQGFWELQLLDVYKGVFLFLILIMLIYPMWWVWLSLRFNGIQTFFWGFDSLLSYYSNMIRSSFSVISCLLYVWCSQSNALYVHTKIVFMYYFFFYFNLTTVTLLYRLQ